MVNPNTPSPARQSRRPATAQNVKNGVPAKLKKQRDFDPFELTKLLATDSDRTNTGGR